MNTEITTNRIGGVGSLNNTGRRIIAGAFGALFMAGSLVLPSLTPPSESPFISLGFVVAIPFIIAFLFTKRVIDALCLVWMNEIFFGGAGKWISLGPISGRGLLLCLLLYVFLVLSISERPGKTTDLFSMRQRDLWILFYGIFFPILLLIYSVGGGAPPTSALSDVQRFFGLLAFFPLRELFREKFLFALGWFAGASLTLAGLFYLLAFASPEVRTPLLLNWLSAGEIFDRPDLTTIRAAFTPQVLLFVSVFLGGLYVCDPTHKWPARLFGGTLLLVGFGTFVGNFIRGPLLSMGFVLCLIAILAARRPYRPLSQRIVVLILILAAAAATAISSLGEVATWRFSLDMDNWLDEDRIEQSQIMIHEWQKEPVFGQGVGRDIAGYTRGDGSAADTGLAFEVQYLMILYRVGMVGFIVLMTPFFFLIRDFFRLWAQPDLVLYRREGKFVMSLSCAIIALLISSVANPYLASVFTPFFLASYLAADDVLIKNISQDRMQDFS